jgi:acetyltransferase EpsM
MTDFVMLGASGHARVLLDVLAEKSLIKIMGFYDDDSEKIGAIFCDLLVRGNTEALLNDIKKTSLHVVLAVGDNSIRARIFSQLGKHAEFSPIISKHAVVSSSSVVNQSTFVMERVVIHANSNIGKNAIINTAAVIEHDNTIGDHVHIAPGALLCGHVTVGEKTLVGVGVCVIPGIRIGKNSIVAAGSVVTQNVPDDVLVAGNPAVIKKRIN